VLNTAGARDQAEPYFRLTEDRRLACGKAHVARQHELATCAPNASRDLSDRHKPACAQVAKQQTEGRFTSQLHRLFPILRDARDVDVRNEVVGVGAREYEYLTHLVSLGSLNQRDEIADQFGPKKIHGWGRDVRE